MRIGRARDDDPEWPHPRMCIGSPHGPVKVASISRPRLGSTMYFQLRSGRAAGFWMNLADATGTNKATLNFKRSACDSTLE